ncbi:MAG: hypothetical protein A2X35_08680 [Elusimicrobia bacterium GWA2_61_42]|nr:MAG: hypothetical protein A2X35_08680 [Elusimicrobia bacterium GWA2_61_42]OGR77310.1 MAG: hypothetical protein A2X38_09230 [Elusimicrobia bacterium GWC2_61_25]
MKKILLTLAAGLCACGAVSAAELSFTDQLNLLPAAAAEVTIPMAPAAPARSSSYVQVNGYVTLSGMGWVPGTTGGFTSVTLTGWATFRDSSGRITSNNAYISVPVSMWIYPNQSVFQTVWPNVYATFYRNGRIVGSTSMSGSVSVNGWPNSSTVSLNGSGYLSGSIYVEDEE